MANDETPILPVLSPRLAALQARAQLAEAAAKSKELSADEKLEAEFLAREARAREDMAAADKVRRENLLADREAAARIAANGAYLVKGIDLVALFPFGEAPPITAFPTGGVVVVRSPYPEAMNAFYREGEHRKSPVAALYTVLLCDSTIDPEKDNPVEHGKLRMLCENYPPLAIAAGDVVAKLGGSKVEADKRGRG